MQNKAIFFSSRNFQKELDLLTMQIHKIFCMSLWLIGVQVSAMQEVVILTGDQPVFLVALLRARRRIVLRRVHCVLWQEGEGCGRLQG